MSGLNQFTNNASTTLASNVLIGATSLTVATGTGSLFPTLAGSQYFYCTLTNAAATLIEIVKVTARSSDTFTIVRGQDNTSAQAWTAGDKVELRLTAADLQNFPQLDSTNTFAAAQTFSANPVMTGLTASKAVFTDSSQNLTSTGTLGVAQGGTGAATLTANNVLLGNGTSAVQVVAPGTNGNVLSSNGTTWVSTTPASGARSGATTTVFSSSNLTLTLTSSSNQLQIIQGSAAGKIILPDATTMTKGTGYFTFYNSNPYPVAVADSTGTTREYLPVNISSSSANTGASTTLQLIDNSTAAGVWRIGNPIVASVYDNQAIFSGTWDTTKFQSGDYTNLQIVRVGNTTAIAIYLKNSDMRYLYARALTLDTATKTITYGATERQVYFLNVSPPTRYCKFAVASNGTDRGVITIGSHADGVNGATSWGDFIGFAIVSGDLYLSSLVGQTASVSSTGNWTGLLYAAQANYQPMAFYAGSNNAFVMINYSYVSYTGSGTTNYCYIKGATVGVSGTTVTVTEASGNVASTYTGDPSVFATSLGSTFTTGAWEFVSSAYVSGSGRYFSYSPSTNVMTTGTRTTNASIAAYLPVIYYQGGYNGVGQYFPLANSTGTIVWNSSAVYTVTGAGTAAVTGTANTYGYKYKGVEQSSYSTTTATNAMPLVPSYYSTFFYVSSTDMRAVAGNYLYTYDTTSATVNMNRASILPSQYPEYIDSSNLLVYTATAYQFTPIASPYIVV